MIFLKYELGTLLSYQRHIMRSDSNAMDSGRSINSAVDGGDEQPSIFDLALSTRTTRSGATPHQSMPFPFFDLPQELRDFVYGRLTRSRPMGKTKGRFGGLFNIGTCTSTFPELLLVNKQFTEEYQKEVARHPGSRVAFAQVVCPEQAITIHWHDDFPVEPWLDRIPSSKVFNNVTTLNLRVRIFHGAQMPGKLIFKSPIRTYTADQQERHCWTFHLFLHHAVAQNDPSLNGTRRRLEPVSDQAQGV